MLELTKGQITKASKKYGSIFSPKYRAFSILQNQIEDVVKKSTLMWKVIYGLQTMKEGQEDPFEGKDDDNEEDEEKTESDNDQFRVVRHTTKFNFENICDNIRDMKI